MDDTKSSSDSSPDGCNTVSSCGSVNINSITLEGVNSIQNTYTNDTVTSGCNSVISPKNSSQAVSNFIFDSKENNFLEDTNLKLAQENYLETGHASVNNQNAVIVEESTSLNTSQMGIKTISRSLSRGSSLASEISFITDEDNDEWSSESINLSDWNIADNFQESNASTQASINKNPSDNGYLINSSTPINIVINGAKEYKGNNTSVQRFIKSRKSEENSTELSGHNSDNKTMITKPKRNSSEVCSENGSVSHQSDETTGNSSSRTTNTSTSHKSLTCSSSTESTKTGDRTSSKASSNLDENQRYSSSSHSGSSKLRGKLRNVSKGSSSLSTHSRSITVTPISDILSQRNKSSISSSSIALIEGRSFSSLSRSEQSRNSTAYSSKSSSSGGTSERLSVDTLTLSSSSVRSYNSTNSKYSSPRSSSSVTEEKTSPRNSSCLSTGSECSSHFSSNISTSTHTEERTASSSSRATTNSIQTKSSLNSKASLTASSSKISSSSGRSTSDSTASASTTSAASSETGSIYSADDTTLTSASNMQDSELTSTCVEESDTESESTTTYITSSTSSDSSWLDYDYAAYILKPRYEKHPTWVKSLLEKFSTTNNASDAHNSDDTEQFKSTDNKLQEDSHRTTQLIYSCGESGKMVPRLREPRSLYALNKELGPQQAARWPSDLQVINERVHHIQTVPTEPEPFYKQTGLEKCPMARGETNGGRVVFSYETNSSFFMKSRAGGSKNGCDPCAVPLQFENDTTLIFESRFESGNLGKAIQVGEREYELHLRYDLYTNKHTQWFYFRVSNTQADVEYRFTIVNFMKPDSLYNDGMKPVMYSEKEAALNKVGWIRAGNDIKYYKNNLRYETSKGDRYFYSMTWTIKFKHNHDTVYFSHCYPYTYTDLQNYLLELTNDPIKSRICKQRVLCRTLAGNLVYVLSITSASQNPEDLKHKKAVVVTSRVHPGESNSSWMMKGFLDFVTSNSPDAKLLRDTFIFKVVPMLNPDGVVVGNYRCSLTGRDLNRNYKTALKDAYPSVWHTKMMIRKLLLEREVIVYCDLHGHSRRQNVFIYGCEQNQNPNKKFHERIFPSMLSRNTPEKFCYKSCKFKVQKSKEGTGRVVMWNMGIMNSYTMEATFCGSSLGKKKGFHFNQHDFEMMGFHFCDTLLDYCDPDSTKFYKTWLDVTEIHKLTVMAKIAEKGLNPEDVENLSDISTDTESSDGGSDSSISDGPPLHLPFSSSRILSTPKKKKLKSKKDRDKVHKDETKKTSPVEDKRMRNNQVKPLQQDSSKPIKANGPKRTRSLDERTNSGIPVFVQERFEEKKQKRNEYLEALTAAYISNNIPISTDPAFVKLDCNQTKGETEISIISSGDSQTLEKNDSFVHFRYSGTTSDRPNQQPLNGLPALREQPLPSVTHPDGEAYADSTHIKSVFHDLELRRLTPKWLHDAATKLYRGGSSKRGDSPIKISRLFGRRELKTPDATSMEEMLKSQLIQQASVNPINRKHKPHLLEVSAAQQRQTDALSRDKNSPMKTGSNINDEVEESNKSSLTDSSEIVTKPPVSSYTVSTVRVTQTSTPTSSEKLEEPIAKKSAHRRREKSGRKSRKEMREEDEENDRRAQSTSDLSNPKVSQGQPIRSRSANTNHYKSTQLSTIEEIQKSLQSPRNEPSAVNTAGDIIKKLIKETNEEIHDLTNEIQEDIEKKNHQKSRSFANQKQPKETELSRAKPFKDSTGTVAVPFHATPISKIKSTSPNSTVPEQRKNSRELADDKTELPTMLSQPSVFNFSNQIKPVESMTYSSSSLSTLDPIKYITELRSDTVNNKSKENSSKSRNLQRHASFNSAATGVNKINPGRNNSNLSNYTASSSSLHMSATHKSVSPSSDDASPAVWYRQLSSINANQYSSYGHNPKGVKLNRQNLVFKNSENAELADLHVSDIKEARSTADLGETGEQTRARSARSSSRQVIETVPTKISLMICQDHQESSAQFLSHSRQGQRSSVFSRQQTRKK